MAQLVPQLAALVPAAAWSVPAVAQPVLAVVKQASVVDLHCRRALELEQPFRALQDQALSCQVALMTEQGLLQHQV